MTKYTPVNLPKKLLEVRRYLKVSQTGMAKMIAPDEDAESYRTRISMYERGVRVPPAVQLLAYARAARLSVEVLLDDNLDLEFD